jgi:hypothetical protein
MQEIVFSDDGIKVVKSVQQEVVFLGTAGIQGAPGRGIPAGGTAGQYYRKASADDYAGAWVNSVEANLDGGAPATIYGGVSEVNGGTP